MDVKKIPIISPVFNQPTYLRNLVNWWKWYCPENPIYIVDNGSTSVAMNILLADPPHSYKGIADRVFITRKNEFIPNLKSAIEVLKAEGHIEDFYVISDPDIMPHPNTPMNFLDVWKNQIENHGYHRAGFNLITSDLPEYLNEREMIISNEKELLEGREVMNFGPHVGYRAPIDTTFCLYSDKKGGWSSPMNGVDWGNCLRLFEAFHLGWYIDGDNLNDEMKHYFETSKYRVPGEPSAGKNNNRPKAYQ